MVSRNNKIKMSRELSFKNKITGDDFTINENECEEKNYLSKITNEI